MRYSMRLAPIRRFGQGVALGILVLWSTGTGAQDVEMRWNATTTATHSSPEAIIAVEREAEETEREATTNVFRKEVERNAEQWEHAQRERDRKLAEVFDAAEEYAAQAARWQRRLQVLQLLGSSLAFVSAIREPLPLLTEPREIPDDDLGGEGIVLCEESECFGISFGEALGALENAGTLGAEDGENHKALSQLRDGFEAMGPVLCNVGTGECNAGEDLTREPAYVAQIAHISRMVVMHLQRVFPRAVQRLNSLGRAASRLMQRSGERSKQITVKWGKHAEEFLKDGLVTTRDGYARLATHYMRQPHGTYRINHPDGRTLVFDPKTNVFTSFRGDRFITMFRPGESTKYWLRDVQRANLTAKLLTGKPTKTITWQTVPEQVRQQLERISRSGGP